MKGLGLRGGSRSLARCALALLLLVTPAITPGLDARGEGYTEYEVKATYFFRLASFFEWPDHVWPAEGKPLTACVLGADPFGETLDFFDGRSVRGRSFRVRRIERVPKEPLCHLIYVGTRDILHIRTILAELSGHSVLTVGEDVQFASMGGNVAFMIAEERVRLAVNAQSTKRAGLRVSSKLLEFAQVVKEEPQ